MEGIFGFYPNPSTKAAGKGDLQNNIWLPYRDLGIFANTSRQKGECDHRLAGRQGGSCAPPDHGLLYKFMKLFAEHSQVVLTVDLRGLDLFVGAIGTVIHVHKKQPAYAVEFMTPTGETQAVASILPNQIRAFTKNDLALA